MSPGTRLCLQMVAEYPDASKVPTRRLNMNLGSTEQYVYTPNKAAYDAFVKKYKGLNYSSCLAVARGMAKREGTPLPTGKASTTTTTTTGGGGGGKKRGSGQGLLPRDQRTTQQFQPSTPKGQAQAVSETPAAGVSEEGPNWKLIGLGVAVLALVGGGYWWSQQRAEPAEEEE